MGCFQDVFSGFAKYILFFFNLLIMIAAAVFIGLAVKYRASNHGLDFGSATIFPIVLGVFIILVAFFGCCGAVKENSCMLTSYATIMIIIFILQLVLGILMFIAIKKNDNNKVDTVHDYLVEIYGKMKKNDKDARDVVDELQKNLECCGVDSRFEDDVKLNGNLLIQSCCTNNTVTCTPETAYKDNCSDNLTDFFVYISKTIGIVAIIFGAIELVAAIFACCVKHHAGN